MALTLVTSCCVKYLNKCVILHRLHSKWQGSPSAASIKYMSENYSANVACGPNPDVFPPQKMSRSHRLNFSLLTHEPIHASVWALMDAEGLFWEVNFVVQVGKYFGQSCVEDFGCNRTLPRPHGRTKGRGPPPLKHTLHASFSLRYRTWRWNETVSG